MRTFRAVFSIAIVGFLASCQTKPTAPLAVFSTYELSAAERTVVQDGVKASLKDPVSAMFGQVILASKGSDGSMYACGTVNSKNSFGGYTGAQLFIGVFGVANGKPVSFALGALGSDATAEMFIRRECNKYNIFI